MVLWKMIKLISPDALALKAEIIPECIKICLEEVGAC
jgi:hypothetical protein